MQRAAHALTTWTLLLFLAGLAPQAVWAAGQCGTPCTQFVTAPTCTTGAIDICGLSCPSLGQATPCTPTAQAVCGRSTPGTNPNGCACTIPAASCTPQPAPSGGPTCNASAWTGLGCGHQGCTSFAQKSQRTWFWSDGSGACIPSGGSSSTETSVCNEGLPCSNWARYGFVMPGDPVYGFPNIKTGSNPTDPPVYPSNMTKDMIGFAAKGNIIVGDYRSAAFQTNVVPMINGTSASKTQPYVVDPTDVGMGYEGSVSCPGGKTPCFSGDYAQEDLENGQPFNEGGYNPQRRFYQSSLTDTEFGKYLAMPSGNQTMTFAGALYTNHAFAGFVPTQGLTIVNGAMVSRDDGLMMNGPLRINHDIRLLNGQAINQIVLPMTVGRPTLSRAQVCDPNSCSP